MLNIHLVILYMYVYVPVHTRICPRMYTCTCILPSIYVYIILAIYNVSTYMTEAPRVLHFSAFILIGVTILYSEQRAIQVKRREDRKLIPTRITRVHTQHIHTHTSVLPYCMYIHVHNNVIVYTII